MKFDFKNLSNHRLGLLLNSWHGSLWNNLKICCVFMFNMWLFTSDYYNENI